MATPPDCRWIWGVRTGVPLRPPTWRCRPPHRRDRRPPAEQPRRTSRGRPPARGARPRPASRSSLLVTTVRGAETTESDRPTAATRPDRRAARSILVVGLGTRAWPAWPSVPATGGRPRGGRPRRARPERSISPESCDRTQQHWQASYVMGAWAARHLDGDLFQIVAASTRGDDSVDACSPASPRSVAGRRQGTTYQRPDATEVDDAVWPPGCRGPARRRARLRQCATTSCGPCVPPASAVDLVVVRSRCRGPRAGRAGPRRGGIYSASSWCRADAGAFGQDFRTATGTPPTRSPRSATTWPCCSSRLPGGWAGSSWSLLADVLAGLSVTGARGRMTSTGTGSATPDRAAGPARPQRRRGPPPAVSARRRRWPSRCRAQPRRTPTSLRRHRSVLSLIPRPDRAPAAWVPGTGARRP